MSLIINQKQLVVWSPADLHCKQDFLGLNWKKSWEKDLDCGQIVLWAYKIYSPIRGEVYKKKINIPVFPLLWIVLDSAVSLSQPSSCRFWYCSLTWVNNSSTSRGDCLALLQDGYFLPQLRWFRVPAWKWQREADTWRDLKDFWSENVKHFYKVFFYLLTLVNLEILKVAHRDSSSYLSVLKGLFVGHV